MNFEKLNIWLSLFANIGVLAGILFLAIEISESNRQAQSSAYQSRVDEIDRSLREYAASETLPNIYVKVRNSGIESLTEEERERAFSWERARISRMQGQYYQYHEGYLDQESYDTMLEVGFLSLQMWKDLGMTIRYEDLLLAIEEAGQNRNIE